MSEEPLLSVRHLTTEFILSQGQVARALEDVSFDVMPGQTIGLVGESGCGKTTTLMSIMRLLPANGRITSGEVRFQGKDLMTLSEREMRDVRGARISMRYDRIGRGSSSRNMSHHHNGWVVLIVTSFAPKRKPKNAEVRPTGPTGIVCLSGSIAPYQHRSAAKTYQAGIPGTMVSFGKG